MNFDEILAGLARQHHGLVSRAAALDRGVPARALEYRARRGRLELRQPRVYAFTAVRRTWQQELMAACLAADAYASHRSAARLWGLQLPDPETVEVAVRRSRCPRLWDVVVHRATDLRPDDTTRHDGIPTTKPARTMVDLGAVCSQRTVDRAVDDAIATRLVTLDGLRIALARVARPGRSGSGVLRRSLERRYGIPDSHLEAAALRLLFEAGLPRPRTQHHVHINGRNYYIDIAYPEQRLAIEIDGARYHTSPDALHYDDSRQNDLAEEWDVRRFTAHHIYRQPEEFVARVARALGARNAA